MMFEGALGVLADSMANLVTGVKAAEVVILIPGKHILRIEVLC